MWIMLATLRSFGIAIWLVLKPVLGWLLIIVGLIGMAIPIMNGVIFLLIGLALVGPRNRIIRWSRVHLKLFLEWWASLNIPIIGPLGRLARRSARQISKQHRRLRWWWLDQQARRRAELSARHQEAVRSPQS